MEKVIGKINPSQIEQFNTIELIPPNILNHPKPSKVPKKIESIFFSQNNEDVVILSNLITKYSI